MSDYALFVMAPYVAAASLLAGTLSALLGQSRRGPPEPQTMTARTLLAGHKVLAAGLLGTLGAHALMVAWPGRLASWHQPLERLLFLEGGFFLLGLAALAGLVVVIVRHLPHPPPRAMGAVDVSFVAVLLVAVVSGLGIAVLHRWAAAWSTVTLVPYVRSVASLQPDPAVSRLDAVPRQAPPVFGQRVDRAGAFTTPMRLFLAAANRAVDRALTPVGAAVVDKWRLFQHRARQGRWQPDGVRRRRVRMRRS